VEILKQVQYKPMSVVDQVMIIFAGTNGFLDKVPRKDVQAWESQFLKYMHEQRREVVDALTKAREFTPEIDAKLKEAITGFGPQFKA
jgi:F-type H+-transporting ATPase subunit alpha